MSSSREELIAAGLSERQADDMLELDRMRSEPLLPELEPYAFEHPQFGRVLKHPLVFEVPLLTPGMANRMLRQKQAALDEAIGEGNWSQVLWLHERAHRLDALIEYVVGTNEFDEPRALVDCEDEDRDLAAQVWVDSENIDQHTEEWGQLFAGWEPGDPMLFNDDEEEWAELPDPLTVYRAGIDDGGWSWTLDPKVAEFFARRWNWRRGHTESLLKGRVRKANVFGYLTSRGESEVLVPEGMVEVEDQP
jgi:hypothetical protein